MIGATYAALCFFIALQCLNVLARPKSSFQSESWRNLMLTGAVLVMIYSIVVGLGVFIVDMPK